MNFVVFKLTRNQPVLEFNVTLAKPGKHMFVIGYLSPQNKRQEVRVTLQPEGQNETVAKAMLYNCMYRYVIIL